MTAIWFGVFLLWSIATVLCAIAGLVHQIRRRPRHRRLLMGPPGPMGAMGEDIWVESERKGYTNLNKEEWLERLNDLIHQRDNPDVATRE